MGKIIQLNPKIIRPTETKLRKKSLLKIFSYYLSNKQYELDPPAIRYYHQKEYFTLDGHHRLILADLFNIKSIKVYVADNFGDFLKQEQVPKMNQNDLSITNEKIELRFDWSIMGGRKLEKRGIKTFYDVRQLESNKFLKTIKDLEEYLRD